jgi:hypothetical protein
MAARRRDQRTLPPCLLGEGKIIFTSEHILEIAKLSEILPGSNASLAVSERPAAKERLIGTRSRVRLATAN